MPPKKRKRESKEEGGRARKKNRAGIGITYKDLNAREKQKLKEFVAEDEKIARDLEMESKMLTDQDKTRRMLQGEAAKALIEENMDEFMPGSQSLWLVSAGIKSGKTYAMIECLEKVRPRYWKVYYMSPQPEVEGKIKTHLLPLIDNADWTLYTPENMQDMLDQLEKDIAQRKKAFTHRGQDETGHVPAEELFAKDKMRDNLDDAMFGLQNQRQKAKKNFPADRYTDGLSFSEKVDRDRMLATQGEILIILDDATMVQELNERFPDSESFLGKLIRLRHLKIDMWIIVHNRTAVSPIVRNCATHDTVYNPRSSADKTGLTNYTSGLSEEGLDSLVKEAQAVDEGNIDEETGMPKPKHGNGVNVPITFYKGAPEGRKISFCFREWAQLNWDGDEVTILKEGEGPKRKVKKLSPLVEEHMEYGAKLLERLALYEDGIDPDEHYGVKNWGLATNHRPGADSDVEDEDDELADRVRIARLRGATTAKAQTAFYNEMFGMDPMSIREDEFMMKACESTALAASVLFPKTGVESKAGARSAVRRWRKRYVANNKS